MHVFKWLYAEPMNVLLRSALHPFRRLLPDTFKFPVQGKIKVTYKNVIFTLSGNVTSPVLKNIFWDGPEKFEYPASSVLLQLIPHASVFLDIGSNIGYYSLIAKALHPSLTVYSFEPLPAAFRYLKKNCELNHFNTVHCFPYALSDKEENADFFIRINPKFSFIQDHLYGDSSLNGKTSVQERIKIPVQCKTLDRFAAEHFSPERFPDLIKMDTEGTEDKVIRGGIQTLHRYKPIIMCEIIKGVIEKQMEELIPSLGYEFFEVLPDGKLRKTTRLKPEGNKKDYFLIHPENEKFKEVLKSLIQFS